MAALPISLLSQEGHQTIVQVIAVRVVQVLQVIAVRVVQTLRVTVVQVAQIAIAAPVHLIQEAQVVQVVRPPVHIVLQVHQDPLLRTFLLVVQVVVADLVPHPADHPAVEGNYIQLK